MPDPTTNVFGFTQPTVGGDLGTWGGIVNTFFANLDSYLGFFRTAAKAVTWNNGGTTTIDLSTGTVFSFTVATGSSTIAFSNVPANITAVQLSSPITLVITNGGSQTITWPGSVTWLSGSAPALQASGTDIIDLLTFNNGTTWWGAVRSTTGAFKVGGASASAKPVLLLYQNQGLSTGNTTETSLATYSLPANALAANSQAIRIGVAGHITGTGGPFVGVKFGATYVITKTVSSGNAFWGSALVSRSGATSQLAVSTIEYPTNLSGQLNSAPAETLSGAVTIDFRGNAGSGGATFFYDTVQVEYLAA